MISFATHLTALWSLRKDIRSVQIFRFTGKYVCGVYEVLNPLLSSESFGEWCNGKFGTSCDLAGSLNDVVCRRASLAVSQLKGQHAL